MVSEKEKLLSESDIKPAFKPGIYNGFSSLGEYMFSVLMTLIGFVLNVGGKVLSAIGGVLSQVGGWLLGLLKRAGKRLARPFVVYAKAFKRGCAEIRRCRQEKGIGAACGAGIKMVGRMLFGKRGLAVTAFNYALPIISLVFLFNVVSYANNMTYALKLTINGDFVGYVAEETVFTDAERMVQQRINYLDSTTETVTFEPEYQLEMVGYGSTLTKYQLADTMLASLDAEIEYAYGMYIGNSFYGALVDKSKVEQTLEELLDVHRTGSPTETVAFESEIRYEPGLYLADTIVDDDAIIRLITTKKSVAAYYTAVDGDSPIGISNKLGMSIEEIATMNPDFSENSMIYVGDKLLINAEEPFLAVTVTRTEQYEEYVDYPTSYTEDSTRYRGSSVILQEGVEGVDYVTANVSYVNGVEVSRKVLKRVTVSDPTEQVIALGTKALPTNLDVSFQDVPVGMLYWPVGGSDGGAISEMMWGYGGYTGHDGIDIAAPYGTPIYAADSGRVILSKWYGGYGNCIMIQHDNGMVTVYGHASWLHVSVGEEVTQGQQIADVGSTGRSTGNHLHFEVRIDGVCMNPINYLPWHKRQWGCVEW